MGGSLMDLACILASHDVEAIPTSRRRGPGQTHAAGSLRRILQEHGSGHLDALLALVRGSARNREALNSESLLALSDVLVQRQDWMARPSLAIAFEAIDLDHLRAKAVALRPWPVRDTLRATLYLDLRDSLAAVAADNIEAFPRATVAQPIRDIAA